MKPKLPGLLTDASYSLLLLAQILHVTDGHGVNRCEDLVWVAHTLTYHKIDDDGSITLSENRRILGCNQ